jgi:transcriptional regulator with XRE-family HTH domain
MRKEGQAVDGNRLRSARLDKGLTLREAAELIGVSWKTLQRTEAGLSRPFPGTAKRIADFYGVRVTDLMPASEEAA